jgi:hypothetical protein
MFAFQVELQCLVEYWDDAQFKFVPNAEFTICERRGERVRLSRKDYLHGCVSTIWRITIQTILEE